MANTDRETSLKLSNTHIANQNLESSPLQTDFQWKDFLTRKEDLYAMSKYRVLIDWLDELPAAERPKSALIVGCGSGELVEILVQRGVKVAALDIDQATIDLAKATLGQQQNKVEFHVSRIEDFNSSQKYDLVAATDVLEHIENDLLALQKIVDLTTDNGWVMITVPAHNYLFGIHDEKLAHLRRYNKSMLLNLFAKLSTPVETQKHRYFGLFFVPITWLVSRKLRRPYPLQKSEKSLLSTLGRKVLELVFNFERKLSGPSGTSLLFLGRKTIRNSK